MSELNASYHFSFFVKEKQTELYGSPKTVMGKKRHLAFCLIKKKKNKKTVSDYK